MCGLCGMIGRGIIDKDLEAFNNLLWVNGLRGPHSTGLFTYTPAGEYKKEKYRLEKLVGTAAYFVTLDEHRKIQDRMVRSIFTEVFLGHSRWATVGAINPQNAHPFDTGRYVSAHNGTLTDWGFRDPVKTDSQMMFEKMEEVGVKEVLEGLNFSSSYAISVFDKQKSLLYLATNGDRPLHIALNKERDVLYYASEAAALDFISTRKKLKTEIFECDKDVLFTLDPGKIDHRKDKPWEATSIGRKRFTMGPVTHFADAFENDLLEESCSTCGQLLYGRFLDEAVKTIHGKETYYTCRECISDIAKRTKAAKQRKSEAELNKQILTELEELKKEA